MEPTFDEIIDSMTRSLTADSKVVEEMKNLRAQIKALEAARGVQFKGVAKPETIAGPGLSLDIPDGW